MLLIISEWKNLKQNFPIGLCLTTGSFISIISVLCHVYVLSLPLLPLPEGVDLVCYDTLPKGGFLFYEYKNNEIWGNFSWNP